MGGKEAILIWMGRHCNSMAIGLQRHWKAITFNPGLLLQSFAIIARRN